MAETGPRALVLSEPRFFPLSRVSQLECAATDYGMALISRRIALQCTKYQRLRTTNGGRSGNPGQDLGEGARSRGHGCFPRPFRSHHERRRGENARQRDEALVVPHR